MVIKHKWLVYRDYADDDLHTGEMVAELLKIKGLVAGTRLGWAVGSNQVGNDHFVFITKYNVVHTYPVDTVVQNPDIGVYTDSDAFLAAVKSRL